MTFLHVSFLVPDRSAPTSLPILREYTHMDPPQYGSINTDWIKSAVLCRDSVIWLEVTDYGTYYIPDTPQNRQELGIPPNNVLTWKGPVS